MMGFGGGLLGAAIAMFFIPPRVREVPVTTILTTTMPADPLPPPKGPSEIQMVFRAGDATYMKLGDAPVQRVRLAVYDRGDADDWQATAVGEIEPPAEAAHWLGKSVLVDGTCTAKVTGFAVVARLKGEAGFAGGERWNADTIYEHGTPVLAAKLDGCANGLFARDATLQPIAIPEVMEDPALAKRAQEKLLASYPAHQAQIDWEQQREGKWTANDTTNVRTLVVRHPITKVTWVSVHASVNDDCGGPDINIWGLYRVDGEMLVTAQLRDLGEIHAIDRLIDLEGDGELEMIGTPWIPTDHIVARASGDEVTRLVLSFYGCAC